jgi:translation initiation factor IF-3
MIHYINYRKAGFFTGRTVIDNKMQTSKRDQPHFLVDFSIRHPQVRVLDGKESPTIFSLTSAVQRAESENKNLIQIAVGGDGVPVCKIERFDKFMYQRQKDEQQKQKTQRIAAKRNDVKELQVTVNIEKHDLLVKMNHAKEFFADGRRVKWVLKMRGRETTHTSLAQTLFDTINQNLDACGQAGPLQKEGRVWQQIWQPKV